MDGEMRRAMVRRVVESDMTERVALSLGVKRPRRSVWRPQQSTRKERLLALGVRCFRSAPHPSGAREEEGGSPVGGPDALTPERWVRNALSNSFKTWQEECLRLVPACPTVYSVCGSSSGGHGCGCPRRAPPLLQ